MAQTYFWIETVGGSLFREKAQIRPELYTSHWVRAELSKLLQERHHLSTAPQIETFDYIEED